MDDSNTDTAPPPPPRWWWPILGAVLAALMALMLMATAPSPVSPPVVATAAPRVAEIARQVDALRDAVSALLRAAEDAHEPR